MKLKNYLKTNFTILNNCKIVLLCSSIAVSHVSFSQQVPYEMLGIQADGTAFIDMARQERAWEKIAGGTALADQNGWPLEDAKKVFFDNRAFPAWLGDDKLEDPDKYNHDMSGTWKLSFDGQADISIEDGAGITFTNKVYNSATNRTSVNVNMIWDRANQRTSLCYLRFTNTKRTASSATNTGINNVKMIRPGYDENSTELLADGYFDAICPFGILRTMGLTATNNFPALGQFFGSDPTYA